MLNLPPEILRPLFIAGILLGFMSVIDTLAYGVRTAGVLSKRLALSLALFNVVVTFSRLGNLVQAPIIGNYPDKVNRGVYTTAEVLLALRVNLLFVVGGVIIGALLMPSFINLTRRGIEIVERSGSLPPAVLHGLLRIWRLPLYLRVPRLADIMPYMDLQSIPRGFLIFNVFVTCFYSIGVMSTVMAASLDHNVAATSILLSGIVNGIGTLLLFIIVDPPAAIIVDQCIAGIRPESHAITLNFFLVCTRLAGTLLAITALPLMARYVLAVAHWVDAFLA